MAEDRAPGTGGLGSDRFQSGGGKASQVGLPGRGTGGLSSPPGGGTGGLPGAPSVGAGPAAGGTGGLGPGTGKLPPPEGSGPLPQQGSGLLAARPSAGLPTPQGLDLWGKKPAASGPLPPPRPSLGHTKPLAPTPPVAVEDVRAELAKHAEFEAVMASRMRFLTYVLGLQSRSPAAVRLALAKQKADIAQMAEGLLLALAKDPGLAIKMQEALERSAQAGALAREAEQRLARHDELPAALAAGALQGFDLPGFRRAIFWLSTLDASFAHQPILAQIFPPVARKGSPPGAIQAAPKKLPPKAPPGPAPAGDRPLQQPAKSSPLAPRGDPTPAAGEASAWLGRAVRRLESWLEDQSAR